MNVLPLGSVIRLKEIYFTGYVDEMEKEFLKQYELQKDKIKYPKLKIKAD